MEQRGKTVGQKEKREKKEKDFLRRTGKHAVFPVGMDQWLCSAPKVDYLFSLQTVFRGEVGEVCSVV